MRRLRDVLRLKYEAGLPHRAIAQACSVGLGTVSSFLTRATAAGLTWPLPEGLDDAALEARLFARPADAARLDRTVPEWPHLHQELKRSGVTLQLLWNEYRAAHPTGYAYSHFCDRYRRWARVLKPSMRQVHRAGEKMFVDFSGKRPSLVDATTGELVPVELFVGALGASGLIYAEATGSQALPCWVAAHVHMMEYVGGSCAIWVPDNLKSGVTTANYYEPEINRTYADLARHYGAIVLPARAAHPQDKPKVEVSVQIAQRWILAVLRHQTFFTLADLNAAIRTCVDTINDRPMQVVGVSRRVLFEQLDRPALRPLPRHRYELATWKPCRVNIDYHVEVDHNWYSVPYQLVHVKVEARVTQTTVEVFLTGRRVASHAAGASRPRRMDALPVDRVGRPDWPGHRAARGRHPRAAPASGAGLSRLPRAHAPGPRTWRRSTRRRLRARRAPALLQLSHGRAHSHAPAGSAPARRARACATRAHAREPAWRALLRGGLC
jgi:transposase